MTDCANNNLNPNIGPSGNTSSIDDKIQEFNTRIESVGEKLDILTASLGSPEDYDDNNIVADDMASLQLGGGGGGGECQMDLTIKANTYVTNVNSMTFDQCDTPLVFTVISDQFVANSDTSMAFGGTGTLDILNTVPATGIASPVFAVTSTTSISLTGPADSSITIGSTTLQSILDRLTAVESAAAAAQTTADGKVSTSTFNAHTHTFSDTDTVSITISGTDSNGDTFSGSDSDTVNISGTTGTP